MFSPQFIRVDGVQRELVDQKNHKFEKEWCGEDAAEKMVFSPIHGEV